VQLFFVGIVGECIGSIYTQVRNHPHVFEKERINFDDGPPLSETPRGEAHLRSEARLVGSPRSAP